MFDDYNSVHNITPIQIIRMNLKQQMISTISTPMISVIVAKQVNNKNCKNSCKPCKLLGRGSFKTDLRLSSRLLLI
jgi:hypothetical protein